MSSSQAQNEPDPQAARREGTAMVEVAEALKRLDGEERRRVLMWAARFVPPVTRDAAQDAREFTAVLTSNRKGRSS